MNEPVQYMILRDDYAHGLAKAVSECLNNGWKLAGGVSVSVAYTPGGSEKVVYAQAIIKEPVSQ